MLPAIQGYIRSAIPDTDTFSKVICPENNISPKGEIFTLFSASTSGFVHDMHGI